MKFVSIKISLNERKFVIVGIIYRHSCYDFKEFCVYIAKNIKKLTYNMYTFVICGDIDIDLVKYDKDNKVNNYVNAVVLKLVGGTEPIKFHAATHRTLP